MTQEQSLAHYRQIIMSLELETFGLVILIDTALRALGCDADSSVVVSVGTVELLLEDRLGLDLLKLGLEALEAWSVAAAVGATSGIG